MAQVFGFVKQSAGHVKIYSEPGHGSTSKLYFSRLLGAELEESAKTLPSQTTAGGESILVVEDNEDVRVFTAQVPNGIPPDIIFAPSMPVWRFGPAGGNLPQIAAFNQLSDSTLYSHGLPDRNHFRR